MNVVFMGTPDFAVPSLEALLRSDDAVVGVVTQPDRPKGRGQALAASPVKQIAERERLPLLQPLKMKDPLFLDTLRAWRPDLIVVTAFGRILPPVVLDLPPRGCVNVHASLLPKYRGAGPIQWALVNGERETGITTMQMEAGMDTGPILLQAAIPVDPDDTAGTLSAKLAVLGARLLIDTIRRVKEGTLQAQPQDDTLATMAPLLKKEDGLLDWTRPAPDLANRIRGLTPWPGAFTYAGPDRWVIHKAYAEPPSSDVAEPGTVVAVTKDAIQVATGKGTLSIRELQPSNSRRMTALQFLAGHRITPGLTLQAAPASR